MADLVIVEQELLLLEEVWTPPEEEYLASLLENSKIKYPITPEEKAVVDGQAVLGIIQGCYFVPDGFSENDRFYPMECYKGEYGVLDNPDFQKRLDVRRFFGAWGHEDKELDEKDFKEGNHAISTYKLWIDQETGLGMGRSYILNTCSGWNLWVPMRAGARFPMSTRARGLYAPGEFKNNPKTSKRVPVVNPKTFKMLGIDVVNNPGFKQTGIELVENKQKRDVINVRRISDMGLEESLTKTNATLTEALHENANLKVKSGTLEEKVLSLTESMSALKEKTNFVGNISESVLAVVKNFSAGDWDALMNSKLKPLGESKQISYKKNNCQYDAALIPVNLPVITESRLRAAVMSNTKLFESAPVDLDVVNRAVTPEFGTNGLVLCWPLGARPLNLNESISKFVKLSGLFEKDEDTDYDGDEGDEDEDDDSDKKPVSEKKKKSKKAKSEAKDQENEEELQEWRSLAEGKSPVEFEAELQTFKENFDRYASLGSYDSLVENAALHENKDSVELLETFQALGTVEQVGIWKTFYEDVSNEIGDPDAIYEELQGAKVVYSTISEKYGTLEKVDLALTTSAKRIQSLQEALGNKAPEDAGKPLNESMDVAAQRISGELDGYMSMHEAKQVLERFKGNVNEAEESVFKFIRKSKQARSSEAGPLHESKNQSTTPGNTKVEKNTPKPAGVSLLGGFYDSLDKVRK
jgi:hypothetical protein